MKNYRFRGALFGLTFVAVFNIAVPAQAATYEWDYAGSPCIDAALCLPASDALPRFDTGHGFLTTGGPITVNGAVGNQITSFTGTWDGLAITGLLPTDPNDLHYFFNNNTFFDPPGNQSFRNYLDFEGIGFSVSDGSAVNFFFILNHYFAVSSDDPPYGYGSFTGQSIGDAVTFHEVPGPIVGAGLPGLMGLMLASGGLLGWWRRRQKIT